MLIKHKVPCVLCLPYHISCPKSPLESLVSPVSLVSYVSPVSLVSLVSLASPVSLVYSVCLRLLSLFLAFLSSYMYFLLPHVFSYINFLSRIYCFHFSCYSFFPLILISLNISFFNIIFINVTEFE